MQYSRQIKSFIPQKNPLDRRPKPKFIEDLLDLHLC